MPRNKVLNAFLIFNNELLPELLNERKKNVSHNIQNWHVQCERW